MKKFVIYNPEGVIVFTHDCETKRECIDKFTGGNRIQWKGRPSAGWKCVALKENEGTAKMHIIAGGKMSSGLVKTTTGTWNPEDEEHEEEVEEVFIPIVSMKIDLYHLKVSREIIESTLGYIQLETCHSEKEDEEYFVTEITARTLSDMQVGYKILLSNNLK